MSEINMADLINAKNNSIGISKKDKLVIKIKKITKTALTLLIALCLVVATCACGNHKKTIEPQISNQQVALYIYETDLALKELMEENGLEYGNHTVEEYRIIIQNLNEDDIYVYYTKLGNAETQKICQAFGYADLNDYLTKKGYVDEKGEPSIEALRDASYVYMTNEMAGRSR